MTQAEQFIKEKYGVPIEALKLNTQELFHLMDNFVYETLKSIIKDTNNIIRRDTSEEIRDIIVKHISNIKEKFHQV